MGPSAASNPGTQKQRAAFFLVLGLIASSVLAIRMIRLGDIPNGLHVDEAAIGYSARSVLDTGRDEYGEFLSLYF